MGGGWQVSAGDLAEFLGPAVFAFAALASAWVLSDSRRRAGRLQAACWTLVTLLAPFVALPLYLAARLFIRSPDATDTAVTTDSTDDAQAALARDTSQEVDAEVDKTVAFDERADDGTDTAVFVVNADEEARPPGLEDEGGGVPRAGEEEGRAEPAEKGAGAAGRIKRLRARWREFALPVGYAAALLTLGFVYFALERQSFDAHFARAKRAKLRGDTARTVREYRAALRLREDAHTRKLLGVELLREGSAAQALEEFRAAARAAEADDSLAFQEAQALEALGRRDEAAEAYRRFTAGPLCARDPSDSRCAAARERLGRP